MKRLLNGIMLCSLALAPGFASPLSRLHGIFTQDNLAMHAKVSLDPSVTVEDDGPGSTAATLHAANFAGSAPVALPIGNTPEPGSVFLMLAGGAVIVLLRKRYSLNSR
jgi:hypothetical protein